MTVSERIDRLVESGWCVVDSDFDPIAFRNWRQQALDCLTVLLEPDHPYVRLFKGSLEEIRDRDDFKGHASTGTGMVNGMVSPTSNRGGRS